MVGEDLEVDLAVDLAVVLEVEEGVVQVVGAGVGP